MIIDIDLMNFSKDFRGEFKSKGLLGNRSTISFVSKILYLA